MDWIIVAEDKDRQRTLVNVVMHGIWLAEVLLAIQERFCYTELVSSN